MSTSASSMNKVRLTSTLDELESLEFVPAKLGLPDTFSLTSYATLKGCGCKVPRAQLLPLLDGIGDGIGMDSSIKPIKSMSKHSETVNQSSDDQTDDQSTSHTKLTKSIIRASAKHSDYSLVSSTDFFYPLVEDPFIMGQIAAANVLSDVYATGVTEIDSMLMILGSSTLMDEPIRTIVTRSMIEGFAQHSESAGVQLSGGQSIFNPWPMLGGTAMSCVPNDSILWPHRARVGDMLVLTKPLGVQIATNIKQWSHYADYEASETDQSINQTVTPEAKQRMHDRWLATQSLDTPLSRRELLYIFHRAQQSCMRLNRVAAQLAHKYEARACTDITGFGLMGHATNLAALQAEAVDFVIHTLPCISGTMRISDALSMRLRLGLAAETSGGLLLAMSPENATKFCAEIQSIEDEPAWAIGNVVAGKKSVRFENDLTVIDV